MNKVKEFEEFDNKLATEQKAICEKCYKYELCNRDMFSNCFAFRLARKLHASEQARKELKKKLKGKMMNIKYDIGDCIRHKDFISQWSDTKKRNIPKEIVSDIVRIIEIRVSKHNDGKAIQYITNRGHWLFENDIIELTKAELKQQIK